MSRQAAWALAAALLLAFAIVALAVLLRWPAATDARLLAGLRLPGAPGRADLPNWLVSGSKRLTWGGAGIVRAPLALLGALLLALGHERRAAAALLCGWAGESLLVELIKAIVRRARPDLPWRLVHAGSFSFPSGHAAGTMLLYPLLGLFLGRLIGARAGRAGLGIGIVIAIAIGLTRILLGVHWASDVIGGWLLGGAIAAFAAPAGRRSPRP